MPSLPQSGQLSGLRRPGGIIVTNRLQENITRMTILQEQETQDITLLSRGPPDLSIAHQTLVGHGGGGGGGGVQCDDGGGQQEGDDVLLHYSIRNTLCLM